MRIAERIYYAFVIAFLCNLAEGLRWDLLPETRYRTSVRREGAWREAGLRVEGLLKFHYASPVPMQQGISREW
jgi:hypothetical protein